jgi:beta-propeller repeat-containing protein
MSRMFALLVLVLQPFEMGAQQEKWIRQFGTSNDDQARAILAADSAVYVTGWTVGELPGQKKVGRQDAYLRRYDPDGNELWTRQFGLGNYAEGRAIAATVSEVYVAGAVRDDVFVRKYDANGKELWTRQFGTASDADDQVRGIALDNTGIYIAGSTADTLPGQTSAGNADAFVRKYNPEGKELWTRQFGSSSFDQARAIAVNASGVYVTGLTTGVMPDKTSAGSHDVFLRKYDAAGKELWTRQFGSASLDDVCGIAVDESGVYVAGTTLSVLPGQASVGSADMFVRKYDADGNELWTRQFGTAEYDQARGLSVHGAGVYVAGWTLGTVAGQRALGLQDALIVRFSTAGEPIWTRQFGSSNVDDPSGISVDASGIYLAGLTGGRLQGQKNAGNVDTFVAKFDHATGPTPKVGVAGEAADADRRR